MHKKLLGAISRHERTGFPNSTAADDCDLNDPVGRAFSAWVLRNGRHVLDQTHSDKRKILSTAYDGKLGQNIHRRRKSNVRIEVSQRHTRRCCL